MMRWMSQDRTAPQSSTGALSKILKLVSECLASCDIQRHGCRRHYQLLKGSDSIRLVTRHTTGLPDRSAPWAWLCEYRSDSDSALSRHCPRPRSLDICVYVSVCASFLSEALCCGSEHCRLVHPPGAIHTCMLPGAHLWPLVARKVVPPWRLQFYRLKDLWKQSEPAAWNV